MLTERYVAGYDGPWDAKGEKATHAGERYLTASTTEFEETSVFCAGSPLGPRTALYK